MTYTRLGGNRGELRRGGRRRRHSGRNGADRRRSKFVSGGGSFRRSILKRTGRTWGERSRRWLRSILNRGILRGVFVEGRSVVVDRKISKLRRSGLRTPRGIIGKFSKPRGSGSSFHGNKIKRARGSRLFSFFDDVIFFYRVSSVMLMLTQITFQTGSSAGLGRVESSKAGGSRLCVRGERDMARPWDTHGTGNSSC
uniref:Uncharacterized protein n=1 Tax=Cacopsylla melanoneura TaxID=428564 RepID=A0A8D8U5Q6_9HEMI